MQRGLFAVLVVVTALFIFSPSIFAKLRKAFDLAILSYEKALLERSAYSVTTTASAREGLVLVTACKFDPVPLDYETPVMNRCDVAVEMKRVRPELAVILLSGSEVPTYALTLVDAFIPKLEASRALLPTIAALCDGIRYPKQK
jgi:CheY-like chemotaxis protein